MDDPREPRRHGGDLSRRRVQATASSKRNDLPVSRCLSCKLRKVRCTGGPSPCRNCDRLGLNCVFRSPADRVAGPHGIQDEASLLRPTVSQTEAGTVRLRTIAACDECRLRKAKCSGQRPRCYRCDQRQLPCVYNADRGKRQHPAVADESRPPDSASPASASATATATGTMAQPSTYQPPTVPQAATLAAPATISLHVAAQKRFLGRDVLAQHIDAYYVYVYHVPGYDIFHRPAMLEDMHNDRIPPILCTALCAAVSMYISRSEESRRLSLQWAQEADAYIFSNMNNLEVLNLQLMILSVFQHFAYRQFGRVWLMQGMAARLVLGMQLNKEGAVLTGSGLGVASRECNRRLAWSLFLQDKQHSGGVEEFLTLPEQWMSISLPLCESDFLQERDRRVGTLSDDFGTLSSNGLGINGFLNIVMNLRYHILRATKAVIAIKSAVPAAEVQKKLAPLFDLRERLKQLYASLPAHLVLSDRNIFSHSATPELAAYISLHTWYFQGGCDLFRLCLPGASRESASASFLANAPESFVKHSRCMAVSCARAMAANWQRLLDMKRTRALVLPGGLLPLDPAGCVNIYQCTKVLLIARRYQLYEDLVDPVSGTPVSLDDEQVVRFCQSNVAYLGDLASVAPIAAVVLRDVREMIEKECRRTPGGAAEKDQPPVTSQIQQEKILSRYNVLAMGIAASSQPHVQRTPLTPALSTPSVSHTDSRESLAHTHHTSDGSGTSENSSSSQIATFFPRQPGSSMIGFQQQQQQQDELDHVGIGLAELDGGNPMAMATGAPPPYGIAPDYTVTASQFDMSGELDWFLMNGLSE